MKHKLKLKLIGILVKIYYFIEAEDKIGHVQQKLKEATLKKIEVVVENLLKEEDK